MERHAGGDPALHRVMAAAGSVLFLLLALGIVGGLGYLSWSMVNAPTSI